MGSGRAGPHKLEVSSGWDADEFCHRGGQFAHVVHEQCRPLLLQTSPVLRPTMATSAEAHSCHPGGAGGIDTCRAVLDDQTAIRRRCEALRGIKKQIGSRLAPLTQNLAGCGWLSCTVRHAAVSVGPRSNSESSGNKVQATTVRWSGPLVFHHHARGCAHDALWRLVENAPACLG
jgi:hypothetical protein